MKVFISWSGIRSKALAIRLHEWLKAIVQRSEPWMSDRDIEAGQRWNEEISARLKETHFGVICLTPENVSAPWLLFESGALAKAVESARVVPVLLGLRRADLTFPLAQFQAVEADRDGFLALASALNRTLTDNQLEPSILSNLFDALWPPLERKVVELRAISSTGPSVVRRTDREVLDDVLESVRVLHRVLGDSGRSVEHSDFAGDSWEDFYIRGVNLANRRGGPKSNAAALRAYNEAILVAPLDISRNSMSRLYAYRAALFKRLNRLDEAENDLVLAQKWAIDDREIEDAMYNMACVKAMSGATQDALTILRELIARDSSWRPIIANKPEYFSNLKGNADFQRLAE